MGWKRIAARVVLCVLASCEPAREGAAPPPSPTSEPSQLSVATQRVRLDVLADFAVAPAAPDTELTTVRAETLRAGKGSALLLAIERPRVPARCIAEARLRLFAEDWPDETTEELGLFPSFVFDALRKADGDRFGYSGSLLDVRPRATLEGVTSGWAEWDVTRIVKLWAANGEFPSQGRRAPERGPIVLAMRDAELAEPLVAATVAATESSHPPKTFAFVDEGCGASGRA